MIYEIAKYLHYSSNKAYVDCEKYKTEALKTIEDEELEINNKYVMHIEYESMRRRVNALSCYDIADDCNKDKDENFHGIEVFYNNDWCNNHYVERRSLETK